MVPLGLLSINSSVYMKCYYKRDFSLVGLKACKLQLLLFHLFIRFQEDLRDILEP